MKASQSGCAPSQTCLHKTGWQRQHTSKVALAASDADTNSNKAPPALAAVLHPLCHHYPAQHQPADLLPLCPSSTANQTF